MPSHKEVYMFIAGFLSGIFVFAIILFLGFWVAVKYRIPLEEIGGMFIFMGLIALIIFIPTVAYLYVRGKAIAKPSGS